MISFKLTIRNDKRPVYIRAWSIKHAFDYANRNGLALTGVMEVDKVPTKHNVADTTIRKRHVDKEAEAERQRKFRAEKKEYLAAKEIIAEYLDGKRKLVGRVLSELEATIHAYESRQRGPRKPLDREGG